VSFHSHRHPTQADEARLILRFVWNIRGKPKPYQWEYVLRHTEPFVGKAALAGAKSKDASDRLLSIVLAVRGDALRELGLAREAADAYRASFQVKPFAGSGGYYAQVVLDHDLEDHYATALAALEHEMQANQRMRTPLAILGWMVIFLRSPIQLFREFLPHWRANKSRAEALRERLEKLPQAPACAAVP